MELVTTIVMFFGTVLMHAAAENTASTEFICVNGAEILLSNVCDGTPHCPDSSDEIEKLCRHIMCPISMFRCAYGACISRELRCNGVNDCVDGSDEFLCDQNAKESCSDREFRCSSNLQCIPLMDTCNGYADCSDGSDENVAICRENFCSEHMHRCAYGGCVHQEVVCDGIKDCFDGTDEDAIACASVNCNGTECINYKCKDTEFTCENDGQCIPKNKVCDGKRHCRDSSDESPEMCKLRECPEGWFRCNYGGCIRSQLKCNLQPDCYDWSDEDESSCGVVLPEGACRLPAPKPGTHYRVSDCPRCRPGEVVPELTRLDYTCDNEGLLEGPASIYCQNNHWIPQIPSCLNENSSQITCPPISEAHGAMKRCEAKWGVHKGWVPCEKPVPVGTRAFLECPVFYERKTGATSINCLHDGTWSQRALSCSPICGIRSSSAAALIVNGWTVTPQDSLPWHATLFSHENGEWKFFCGGTLIAERVVLTAGHCVWRTFPETIRVALAIFSNDLSEANENTQILDVESIVIQDSYQDHEGNYGSDIALLILKQAAAINSLVKPACVAWDSDETLEFAQRTGGIGLVAGMGFTENNTFSHSLRITSLKIIPNGECRKSQKRDFRKYLTYTSFCAGWANGTGVCNGDSGGGLVIRQPNSTVWEIHGVVSVSPRRIGTSMCDPNYYTVFTKVSLYGDWIRKIVEEIPVTGPPDINRQPNTDNIII